MRPVCTKIKIAFCCFYSSCQNTNLFNLLLSTWKSVAEGKKTCYLNLYVKYEQNRWCRHCKIESLFMKPNNLTSLRRMSRVRLACHGFLRSKLTIFSIHTVLHPYSAVTHRRGSRQNPAVPHPLHSNAILKMHVKDWIICLLTTTLK